MTMGVELRNAKEVSSTSRSEMGRQIAGAALGGSFFSERSAPVLSRQPHLIFLGRCHMKSHALDKCSADFI